MRRLGGSALIGVVFVGLALAGAWWLQRPYGPETTVAVTVGGRLRTLRLSRDQLLEFQRQALPGSRRGVLANDGQPLCRHPLCSPMVRPVEVVGRRVDVRVTLPAVGQHLVALRPDVWFVGSSRAERGVDVPAFGAGSATGGGLRAANLAFSGGGLANVALVVEHYLATAPRPPKYVIYLIGAFELNRGQNTPVVPRYFMRAPQILAYALRRVPAGGIDPTIRYYLSGLRSRLLVALNLPSMSDMREAARYVAGQRWREGASRLRFPGAAFSLAEVKAALSQEVQRLPAVGHQAVSREHNPDLAAFEIAADARHHLARLVAACDRRSVRLVLVATPVSDAYQWELDDGAGAVASAFLAEEADRLGFEWLDGTRKTYGLGNEDYVRIMGNAEVLDPDHLNAEGARRFSRRLRERLGEVLNL